MKILEKINGNKTYIICVLSIIYAALGLGLNQLETVEAINIILAALGAAGLRHGVSKI